MEGVESKLREMQKLFQNAQAQGQLESNLAHLNQLDVITHTVQEVIRKVSQMYNPMTVSISAPGMTDHSQMAPFKEINLLKETADKSLQTADIEMAHLLPKSFVKYFAKPLKSEIENGFLCLPSCSTHSKNYA